MKKTWTLYRWKQYVRMLFDPDRERGYARPQDPWRQGPLAPGSETGRRIG